MRKQIRRRNRRRGFTLVEVLLVLVILVVIASLAVQAYGPIQRQANEKAARAQIGVFEGALGMYRLNINDFPATEQGLEALREAPSDLADPDAWLGPYLNKTVPLDPWKQPYQYEWTAGEGETNPRIWSMGPDMIDGSDDDVSNMEED